MGGGSPPWLHRLTLAGGCDGSAATGRGSPLASASAAGPQPHPTWPDAATGAPLLQPPAASAAPHVARPRPRRLQQMGRLWRRRATWGLGAAVAASADHAGVLDRLVDRRAG